MVFGSADAGGSDAGLRRDGDRLAADHLRCDEPVHGPADRSVHRRTRRRLRPPAARRLCAKKDDASAYAYDAEAQHAPSATPMPRSTPRRRCRRPLRSALERVGGGIWRLADHRRQCALGSNSATSRRVRHRGRRRLSLLAATPWPALRWPAAAPISASPMAAAAVPTCSRPARSSVTPLGPAYISARAGLWLAGHHHRPHRRPSPASISCARASTPTPSRAASKAAIASSRHGSAASASRPTRPASSRPSICRPMPRAFVSGANTFALAYGAQERHRYPQRTRHSHRQILRDARTAILTLRGRFAWAHDFNPDRGIGATFQTLPGASFRRQRRGAGERLRADDGLRRNEMDQRLVRRRDLRGRVLRRHRAATPARAWCDTRGDGPKRNR